MCQETILFYNISTDTYQLNTSVTPDKNLNGFTVKNSAPIGGNTVFINGDPLVPGESKTVGGNRGEIFRGRIDITFLVPALGVNSVVLTQKFYVRRTMDLPLTEQYI
jgi:hypothetical protein